MSYNSKLITYTTHRLNIITINVYVYYTFINIIQNETISPTAFQDIFRKSLKNFVLRTEKTKNESPLGLWCIFHINLLKVYFMSSFESNKDKPCIMKNVSEQSLNIIQLMPLKF